MHRVSQVCVLHHEMLLQMEKLFPVFHWTFSCSYATMKYPPTDFNHQLMRKWQANVYQNMLLAPGFCCPLLVSCFHDIKESVICRLLFNIMIVPLEMVWKSLNFMILLLKWWACRDILIFFCRLWFLTIWVTSGEQFSWKESWERNRIRTKIKIHCHFFEWLGTEEWRR